VERVAGDQDFLTEENGDVAIGVRAASQAQLCGICGEELKDSGRTSSAE